MIEFMKNYLRLFLCPGSIFAVTFGAALMAGKKPDLWLCLAGALVTFAIYTLDRLKSSEEDAINNPERSSIFLGKEKLFMGLIAASFLAAILITALIDVWKVLYVLVPIGTGLIYTARIGGHRLKDIPFAKTIVVATSLGTLTSGLAGFTWPVFALISMNLAINTIVCDIRDIEGDRLHGVRTIPVMIGTERTRLLLVVLASCMWFLLPLSILSVTTVIFSYLIFVLPFNEWFVDGSWMIIVGISMAISQVIHI